MISIIPGKIILFSLLYFSTWMCSGAGAAELKGPENSRKKWPLGASCAVTLTFDDANPYHAEVILPLLKEYGLKATFFLNPGGLVFAHPEDAGRKPRADWSHYRQLAQAGMEIGSHTIWHNDLTQATDKELEYELKESKADIEFNTGFEVSSFAYPYNSYNNRTEEKVRAYYKYARTGTRRIKNAPLDAYVDNSPKADLLDLKAVVVQEQTPIERLVRYVDRACRNGTWIIFQFHGVNGLGAVAPPADYYDEFFSKLAALRGPVWVATMQEAGAYLRSGVIVQRPADEFKILELPPTFFHVGEPMNIRK